MPRLDESRYVSERLIALRHPASGRCIHVFERHSLEPSHGVVVLDDTHRFPPTDVASPLGAGGCARFLSIDGRKSETRNRLVCRLYGDEASSF